MSVLRVGQDWSSMAEVTPDPASMTWGLQDISSSDAGRVQDAGNTMYKMRTSQKRKLQLSWSGLTEAQAARILQQFNPEYFQLEYPDALTGGRRMAEFYAGDRTAPMKWYQLSDGTRYSTLSFDVIER